MIMSSIATLMLVVSLLIVPGGLIASTIFLKLRPELEAYPELPANLHD